MNPRRYSQPGIKVILSQLSRQLEHWVVVAILSVGSPKEREKLCEDLGSLLSSLSLKCNRISKVLLGRKPYPHTTGKTFPRSGTDTSPIATLPSNKPKQSASKSL